MFLSVEHATDTDFGAERSYSIQYVRLTPRPDPVQKVVRWRLDTPGRATAWRDGFGNIVHTVVRTGRHDSLPVTAWGTVDTTETHGILRGETGGLPPHAFLRATPLTMADETALALCGRHDKLLGKGSLPALHGLMAGIHDGHADTPARDLAHLFIACCRTWGIPARFVSGYLHTSAEDGRQRDTHAWAEALVEDLGWVSFDPANCQSATQAYIRLAVAFDAEGAAPVRTPPAETLGETIMHVQVTHDQ